MILTLPAIKRKYLGEGGGGKAYLHPEFLLQNTHYEMRVDLLC